MTKRFGFTLAEVLITLGIIGVVAAMTIPTLVKNYQKTVWVNQLKKEVSIFENGIHKMLADDEVDDLQNTKLWKEINLLDSPSYDSDSSRIEVENIEENILKNYFNITRFCDEKIENCQFGSGKNGEYYKLLDGTGNDCDWSSRRMYLADGSIWGIDMRSDCSVNYFACAVFEVDVNGQKGPDQWGRDVFTFLLTHNGSLIPIYGKTHYNLSKNPELYWKTTSSIFVNCDPNHGIGFGCAARIIENGWKMDY